MASNSKTFKITCAVANTAYNVLTGTTAAPTLAQGGGANSANKGIGIIFQCQTEGVGGFAGGSDVVTNGGIKFIGPDGAYSPPVSFSSSGYQVADWWVSADTADTVIIVQLIKHI